MSAVLRQNVERDGGIMNAYEIRYRSEIDIFARVVIIANNFSDAWLRFKILYPTRINTVSLIQIIAYDVIT